MMFSGVSIFFANVETPTLIVTRPKRLRFSVWKLRRRNTMPDAIRNHASFRHGRFAATECKTLHHRNAKQRPAERKRALQTMRRDLQREVARLVPVLVVVSLEVVDVDHQETHRIVVTLRTIQLLRKSLFKIAAVRQRRERIGDRHELKLSRTFLPFGTLERERDLWSNYFE